MSDTIYNKVVGCLAATTRYPEELFTPDADLEDHLGIDSVKRVEIIITLSEEFGLKLQAEKNDSTIRTVADVASWIESLLAEEPEAPRDQQSPRVEPHPSHSTMSESVQTPLHQAAPVSNRSTPASPPSRAREFSPKLERVQPHQPLLGKVALVTGSGRGVGKTIASVLADRGATVIVNSFHSREEGEITTEQIRERGGEAFHLWGSVANPDHVDEMFSTIGAEFGLDILICNASDGRVGNFLDLTSKDWDRAFKTNVTGHHHCAVRAAEIMEPRGGGSIITMSAVGAHQFIDGLGAQGVVKAAVESMTRYLACELGPQGIRVNCVAGGPVYGDLLEQFPESQAAQEHWESRTPDGELCTPMDLAETISFLVSDHARAINGAVWMVDHGFSATADGQLKRRVSHAYA